MLKSLIQETQDARAEAKTKAKLSDCVQDIEVHVREALEQVAIAVRAHTALTSAGLEDAELALTMRHLSEAFQALSKIREMLKHEPATA